jgi:hypothetical protein
MQQPSSAMNGSCPRPWPFEGSGVECLRAVGRFDRPTYDVLVRAVIGDGGACIRLRGSDRRAASEVGRCDWWESSRRGPALGRLAQAPYSLLGMVASTAPRTASTGPEICSPDSILRAWVAKIGGWRSAGRYRPAQRQAARAAIATAQPPPRRRARQLRAPRS